jgi:3-hydroxybutyryl-CoA dehydrogenase
MRIAVIADDILKEEWLAQGLAPGVHMEWLREIMASPGIDCYIDLLFDDSPERITALDRLGPAIVIVNSVTLTLAELPGIAVRINGWSTFLQRPLVEACAVNGEIKKMAGEFLTGFNKQIEWVPDIPGFISARVIGMIINEAWYALEEEVSSKEEIDTAMKLGTNYPFGPFEWGQKIGLKNICSLLNAMSAIDTRYMPAELLKKEAGRL